LHGRKEGERSAWRGHETLAASSRLGREVARGKLSTPDSPLDHTEPAHEPGVEGEGDGTALFGVEAADAREGQRYLRRSVARCERRQGRRHKEANRSSDSPDPSEREIGRAGCGRDLSQDLERVPHRTENHFADFFEFSALTACSGGSVVKVGLFGRDFRVHRIYVRCAKPVAPKQTCHRSGSARAVEGVPHRRACSWHVDRFAL